MNSIAEEPDVLTRLKQTDPNEFEEFVADLWESRGWETEVMDKGADGGIDVVATRDGVVGQRMLIQAKRYTGSNKVSAGDIRQYAGVRQREIDADSLAIVTTNEFTSTAEEEAKELNIKLIDGQDICQLLEEYDAAHLVDRYAPTLRDDQLDPAHTPATSRDTDELGVEVEGKEDVDLPEPLADDDTRTKISGGFAVVGIVLFLNPTGIGLPIEAVGTLVLLAGAALYLRPKEAWDFVTPTREVYREFDHGGTVALDGNTIQYEPPTGDARTFDNEDQQRARQRAVVYGALDQYLSGEMQETEPGVLPTQITNEGERQIAAYRFAVHDDAPATIASEMNMSQQVVVDHLRDIAE